ncbi:hypothetical protein CSA37_11790 [Candidatus Fermentibacteria bacterium]|nr:MAG: hypothetical protein CSA37_11790 [Candidatus Fermentibacteria bacterium]
MGIIHCRMFSRSRMDIVAAAILLTGIAVSGISAKRITPIPPEDYIAYASGWLASDEGLNPYVYANAASSSAKADITLPEQYSLVYPPPFLLLMEPLRFLSPLEYSRIWLIILLLTGWAGVFLSSRVITNTHKRLMFVLSITLLLSVSGPMISAVRWGQISPFLFFSLGVALFTGLDSRIGGAALSVFLLTKIGLTSVILALNSRRAWGTLLIVLLSLSILSIALYGLEIWSSYLEWLDMASSEWTLSRSNNLSIFGITTLLSQSWFIDSGNDLPRAERVTEYAYAQLAGKVLGTLAVIATMLISILILNHWKLQGICEKLVSLDRVVSAALLAWLSVGACPIVYDHYGLLLVPLVAVSFAKFSTPYALVMFAFASIWCLLPASSTGIGIMHSIVCFAGTLVFAVLYSRKQLERP